MIALVDPATDEIKALDVAEDLRHADGRYRLAATRRNTPLEARRWGFLMNMGVDSFRSTALRHGVAGRPERSIGLGS